jgi:hypothetical protein
MLQPSSTRIAVYDDDDGLFHDDDYDHDDPSVVSTWTNATKNGYLAAFGEKIVIQLLSKGHPHHPQEPSQKQNSSSLVKKSIPQSDIITNIRSLKDTVAVGLYGAFFSDQSLYLLKKKATTIARAPNKKKTNAHATTAANRTTKPTRHMHRPTCNRSYDEDQDGQRSPTSNSTVSSSSSSILSVLLEPKMEHPRRIRIEGVPTVNADPIKMTNTMRRRIRQVHIRLPALVWCLIDGRE